MKKRLILIFVIFIIGAYFVLYQNKSHSIQPVLNIKNTIATTTIYQDQLNGFSFDYPKEFSLADKETLSTQSWNFNSTSTGNLLVRVLIPRTIQPKTNFGEAVFDVGIGSDKLSVKDCLVAPEGNFVGVSSSTVNGVDYLVFHYNDAGAGNFYDVTSYHTIKNGKCFVLDSMIHSSNIGNYSPDQGINEFNKTLVHNILKNITDSFRFLN
ncbi:MAG: hypothetical protein WCF92_00295 [bacterium]